MFHAASLAFNQMFTKPFRGVLWKSLALTVGLLAALWVGVQALLGSYLLLPYPWLEMAIAWFAGVGLFIGLGFFIAPISSIFAGLFVDEIAEVVEDTHYPSETPGKPVPILRSLGETVKLVLVVALVNIVALFLVLFLGLGVIIFFVANGYLLGREYFEAAAFRFHSVADAKALRRQHSGTVFMAGLLIAGFLAIPLLNLLTPLFATALMVHLHKMVTGSPRPEAVSA